VSVVSRQSDVLFTHIEAFHPPLYIFITQEGTLPSALIDDQCVVIKELMREDKSPPLYNVLSALIP